MITEEIILFLVWLTLCVAAFLFVYKYYTVKKFQKTNKRNVRFKTFGFYPQHEIYGTSSADKKSLLIKCNWLTIVIDICLIPVSIVIVINLIELLNYLLNNLVTKID
ncbi:MAG: hypothetical protein V4717_20435 [Bacteroidota bacterium]